MRKIAAAVTALASLATATAVSAEPIRASDSHVVGQRLGGVRVSSKVAKETDLLGAPLFLVFLGAVTITIGAIFIVNNGNSN